MIEEIGIDESLADETCECGDCEKEKISNLNFGAVNVGKPKSKDVVVKSINEITALDEKQELSLYKRINKSVSVLTSNTVELVNENTLLNGSVGLLSGFLGYSVASMNGFGFYGITLGIISSTATLAVLGVSYTVWAAILSRLDKINNTKPLVLQLSKGKQLELEEPKAIGKSVIGEMSQKSKNETPFKVTSFDAELDILSSIEKDWFAIQSDIVKLLKYPMLADIREPLVQEFHTQLSYVKSLSNREMGNEFLLAVSTLQTKWSLLKAEAERVSLTKFDSGERKKVILATKLMNIALNEASTVAERQSAYRKAMEQIEGLVVLPKAVINSIEQAVGKDELVS